MNREATDEHFVVDALVARQGLERSAARKVARRLVTADDDIWEAVLHWARTGELAEEPRVGAHSPASLGARMPASQAFTALMTLRRDPISAERALRHSQPNLRRGRGREFERAVQAVLDDLGDNASVERLSGSRLLKPGAADFVVSGPAGRLLVEAKIATDGARLRKAAADLRAARQELGADHAVIVVPGNTHAIREHRGVPVISVFDLADFAQRSLGVGSAH